MRAGVLRVVDRSRVWMVSYDSNIRAPLAGLKNQKVILQHQKLQIDLENPKIGTTRKYEKRFIILHDFRFIILFWLSAAVQISEKNPFAYPPVTRPSLVL